MADDLTGHAGGEGSDPAPRRPPPAAPAPTRVGPGPDGPPDPTAVTFVQHVDGVWLRWSVVEVDARAVPGAHRARCLVFTRPDCIRRVWDYPADWRGLDEAGLAALSWHR
jgi:hypothetical protein